MSLDLHAIYTDLHAHPELSWAEHRTGAVVVKHLGELGLEIVAGLAGTGVAGILRNGEGPTVLLRADMDGLPVEELTGLEYASRERGVDPDGIDVPVMHACGHDVHVTALLGAVERLVATRDEWSGTLVALFQPAEERDGGAQALVREGLYERIPKPDIVLGQHVTGLPAGTVSVHAGAAMAAVDTFHVTLHGRGGHGSRPEVTVDPVLLASHAVVRLQGLVAREIAPAETGVVTVGSIHAGTKSNIIPAEARLEISVRSFNDATRDVLVDGVARVLRAESLASNAPREPEIVHGESFPVTFNDPEATERLRGVFRGVLGENRVGDLGRLSGSEDVGVLAAAAGAPLVYWFLGGFAPEPWTGPIDVFDPDLPSNHSAYFAPVIEPTLSTGVSALVAAAREYLG
ncbi:amidohydrolase [Agromyces seonyuensis]|uniref:Amidohydrolase n=1 Tax=Agromyces seonyuensis TaxID=2662446 RepID=A0A6I4NYX4_9MICO|nr:amidohydrolase [Agromyces seonyuensis]MWB99506.1 amidohydrolase [Agromyces seonyuensis]